MLKFKILISILALAGFMLSVTGCSAVSSSTSTKSTKNAASKASKPAVKKMTLKLENYDGDFFKIRKPAGWKLTTAGQCSTFAFLVRDPSCSVRQIFMFSEAGPFYMSSTQQQIDMQYMRNGGYPIQWIDMPVVDPLTPENFIQQFHVMARSQIARQFMPDCPTLENFKVVSSQPLKSFVPGGKCALVRAVFSQGGKVAEGMFMVNVTPHMQFMNGPGGGTGYAFLFLGISAPKGEFPQIQKQLVESMDSFTVSKEWVQNCVASSQETWKGVLKAGQTLRESSEIVNRGYEGRTQIDDARAEKYIDSIRGVERVYDPETKQVYEFPNGWYDDTYKTNSQKYNKPNLELLPPGEHKKWLQGTLDGKQHVWVED